MNKPSLWRYYGLTALLLIEVVSYGLCQRIAINLELESARKAINILAALVIGISLIISGIDRVVHRKQYSLLLKKWVVPKWYSVGRSGIPTRLFFNGVFCVLLGGVLTYIGVYNVLTGVMP